MEGAMTAGKWHNGSCVCVCTCMFFLTSGDLLCPTHWNQRCWDQLVITLTKGLNAKKHPGWVYSDGMNKGRNWLGQGHGANQKPLTRWWLKFFCCLVGNKPTRKLFILQFVFKKHTFYQKSCVVRVFFRFSIRSKCVYLSTGSQLVCFHAPVI